MSRPPHLRLAPAAASRASTLPIPDHQRLLNLQQWDHQNNHRSRRAKFPGMAEHLSQEMGGSKGSYVFSGRSSCPSQHQYGSVPPTLTKTTRTNHRHGGSPAPQIRTLPPAPSPPCSHQFNLLLRDWRPCKEKGLAYRGRQG